MTTQCTPTGFISLGQESFQLVQKKDFSHPLSDIVIALETQNWMCRPIVAVSTQYIRDEYNPYDSPVLGIRVGLNWDWSETKTIYLCQIHFEGYLILACLNQCLTVIASAREFEQAKPILESLL